MLSKQLISRKRSLDDLLAILKQTKPVESVNNHHSSALDNSQTSDNKVFQDNNDDTTVNFFVDDVDDDNILIESFPRLFDFNINRLVSNFDIIGIVKTYGRKILRNEC